MGHSLRFTLALLCLLSEGLAVAQTTPESGLAEPMRLGMIGLDTSHSVAFTRAINDPKAKPDVAGCRVVAAYPFGSRDIESSASRIPKYTKEIIDIGIEITDSIPRLLGKVDAVLLETNDGRLHLEQFLLCAQAGKPVFIDKPVAAQLDEVIAIYKIAKHHNVPVFSSSSLRYAAGVQAAIDGKIGKITGCDAFSPCSLEETHSDLFWYGIHGVETLFTVMGTGCESVHRTSTTDYELVTGRWADGRIGTFRGLRAGKQTYGGTAFGTKGVSSLGTYSGYRPLVVQIVRFFKTSEAPVSPSETIEIYAFMAAAKESSDKGGVAVSLASVMSNATKSADLKLRKIGITSTTDKPK